MVCIINKSRLCVDCQYIFLIPYLCQLGMNTSSLSSHLCDCKVPAESLSVVKRKWRDFDRLNSIPYHLKMLIQINICHDFQNEKFVSFLSTAVLLYQGYHEIVWKRSAVIWHCSCVLQGFVFPWPYLEFSSLSSSSACAFLPWFTPAISVATDTWSTALLAVLSAPGFLRQVL